MKKNRFFTSYLRIDDVKAHLTGLGYKRLDRSDISYKQTIQDQMERMPEKRFYVHKKTGYEAGMYCVYAWDPSEKKFAEINFTMSGEIVIDRTKITVGKIMYIGNKAIWMVENMLFRK